MNLNKNYIIAFIAVIINITFFHAQNNIERADSLKNTGHYAEALIMFQNILQADLAEGNAKKIGKDYNNIANVYSNMGNYEKSTQIYFNALHIIEKGNDKITLGGLYYNIAHNYFNIGKRKYCSDFLNKAIKTVENEKGNEYILGSCYSMLGGIKLDEKKYEEAISYQKKAEVLFVSLKQNNSLGNVYTNISFANNERGDYKSAAEYARKSLSIFTKENDNVGIAASYLNLQMAHYYLHNNNGVTNREEILRAIGYVDSADNAIRNISAPETKIKIYEGKEVLYSKLKQLDSSYIYLRKYFALVDSVHAVDKDRQIEELSMQYDFEKKEQENNLLQKTNENQFYLVIILLVSLIAIILISILLLRLGKLRGKQKALQLEQKLLRLQMNPHFLFNAINSIQNYILKNNQQQAYDYLAKFAKLIRIVLNNSQEKTLMLQQELEMIKLYIELEQLRFNNAFEFNLSVTEKINEFQISVPAMLIQPYIENAIWHGLMNLENERKGILNVFIDVSGKLLKIVIEDNGIGRVRATEYKKEDSHRSVGMKLTEQRLLIINKMQEYEKAKVLVTDVTDKDKKVCGTKVEIYIPINGK